MDSIPENPDKLLFRALETALRKRKALTDPVAACRLFNGFTEGFPHIALDRYAQTLVIHSYAKYGETLPEKTFRKIAGTVCDSGQPIEAVLLKERFAPEPERKRGRLLSGNVCADQIMENGVRHAIDLRLNRDCSFYLDSADLRTWLFRQSSGRKVLNTFAYSGSYGTAALCGGAVQVVQTDLNSGFFSPFHRSLALNGLNASCTEFIAGDFFRVSAALRKQSRLFDIVILDPPFFSSTRSGTVDQLNRSFALVNKIRPLVADGGKIVLVNNALFLSGHEFIAQINKYLTGDYLTIGERIHVPDSFFGGTIETGALPSDPAPFNYATKIIVLDITRKDRQKS